MLAIAGQQLYYRQAGVWGPITLPTVAGNAGVVAVAADNTGGIIVAMGPVTTYGGSGVYCTHDHGTTWNYVALNGVNVYALYSFGDTTYALSDIGIYALTCNGIVQNITGPQFKAAGNLQLYPNPTNGQCNAVFTLPALASNCQMDITDVYGNTVKTVYIQPGAASMAFTTDDMSRGVYLCVMKCAGVIADVKQLVVLK
jgi:hypothetical protein